MLTNSKGQIFIGKRIDTRSEAWQMPQGGMDRGEEAEETAYRELQEETSITNARIICQSEHWHSYDFPDYLIPKLWNGRYRGQEQKWFLMEFTGKDDEIDIHTKEAEFSDWRWADIKEMDDLIIPFKRRLYNKIIKEFEDHL